MKKTIEKIVFIILILIMTLSWSNVKAEETQEKKEETTKNKWSSCKIEVEKETDIRNYKFTVSNVTPEDKHTYYYYIGDGSEEPTFSTNWNQLSYDEKNKVLYSKTISNYLELANKQYVYIYEYYLDENSQMVSQIVLNKKELEKPQQKKYTDVFYATMISKITENADCNMQILFNTPWGKDTVRKIHLKIGRISDDTILKNIQAKKSNAFEELLKYAKKTEAFYDSTLNSNSSGTAGGIDLKQKESIFKSSNIIDGEYYFLYAMVEPENGKYVQTEGVTLARAEKNANQTEAFSLFFYGANDFSWKTFTSESEGEQELKPQVQQQPEKQNVIANTSENTTQSKVKRLPDAGKGCLIFVTILIVIVIGITTYKKYEKYNF